MIEPPGLETRVAITLSKAEEMGYTSWRKKAPSLLHKK